MFCVYAYRIFLGFVCSGFGHRFLLPPCSYKSLADQRGQQLLPGLLLAGRSRLQAKVATYPPDVLSGHLCFCHERQHLGVQFLLGAISVFQHTQKVGPCRNPGEIPKNLPVPIACSRVAVSKEALNTNKCWRKAGKKTWFGEELQKPNVLRECYLSNSESSKQALLLGLLVGRNLKSCLAAWRSS